MTEFEREQIVERMFPEWREHLKDGKVIDSILAGLDSRKAARRRSRPAFNNVATVTHTPAVATPS